MRFKGLDRGHDDGVGLYELCVQLWLEDEQRGDKEQAAKKAGGIAERGNPVTFIAQGFTHAD